MTAPNDSTCPLCKTCGAPLSRDAPGELCLRCALGNALEPPAQSSADPSASSADAKTRARPSDPFLRHFGDYELLEEIARGGMGVVYRARQVSLDRIVAVKMILFGPLASAEQVRRFRTEAAAAGCLQHPNIVAIHEVGLHENQHYLAMDYVDGPNLGRVVQEGPLSAKRAAVYVKVIAEAVHYAHERGILHRDLKPSNVLLDSDDRPRVVDFGLAKRLVGTRSTASHTSSEKVRDAVERVPTEDLTLTGQVLGSPNYMPPEQAGSRRIKVGRYSDVYSLGAILYHLLTGRPPFQAETVAQTLSLVSTTDPLSPRVLNPGVARDLETLCLKCLEKEPGKRLPTAQAMADELGRFLNDEPILARPVSRLERTWRWSRRNPKIATLGTAVVALLLAIAVGSPVAIWRIEQQRQRAETNALGEARQRLRAQQSAEVNRQRLVRLNVSNGLKLLAQGDSFGSLPWFVEALKLDQGHPLPEEHHRMRIAAVLRQAPRLLQTWFHRGPVRHAEFHPDGRQVLTASDDKTACVWDAGSGDQVAVFRHAAVVRHASFSADGKWVITASEDGSAGIWHVGTGEAVTPPLRHTKKVIRARFAANGRWVVTTSEDHTARVWDATTGEPATPALAHGGRVADAAFSPDSRRVATLSNDGAARVWDVQTGQLVTTVSNLSHYPYSISFSPDGRRVLAAGWSIARLFDAETGRQTIPPLKHLQAIRSACFSPDGRRILTASEDQTARVWEAHTGHQLVAPLKHGHAVYRASFSPDGRWIITACNDGTAQFWDATTSERIGTALNHIGGVTRACFSPDGSCVLTTGEDGMARLWDVATSEAADRALRHKKNVRQVSVGSDGRHVVTASNDKTARVWEMGTGQPVTPFLPHAGELIDVAFSPDARRVVTASLEGSARVWDAVSGQALTPWLEHTGSVIRVQFSSDGERILTASAAKVSFATDTERIAVTQGPVRIQTWHGASGQPLGAAMVLVGSKGFVEFSGDGRRLVTGDTQQTVRIWDTATGQPVTPPVTARSPVNCARFSPDGLWLVTASGVVTGSLGLGEARVWNAVTGEPVSPALPHRSGVYVASFSFDGRLVATASRDATARIWDVRTGQPTVSPLAHNWAVFDIAFSPDARLVVTASGDRTARIWDTSTGELMGPPLKHPGYVLSALFSPDGMRVVTTLGQSAVVLSRFEPTAHIWDLPRNNRPDVDLQIMAELLSAQRLDSSSSLVALDMEALQRGWQAARAKYPGDFVSPRDRMLTWRQRQVDWCEAHGQWSLAVLHLERLTEEQPGESAWKNRLAQARDRLASRGRTAPSP